MERLRIFWKVGRMQDVEGLFLEEGFINYQGLGRFMGLKAKIFSFLNGDRCQTQI